MAKPKGPVFGVDFLEPNALTEGELANIRVEYHIPDSVVMHIPGPLESLSNPVVEVVFFTDVFKYEASVAVEAFGAKNPSSDQLRTYAIQSKFLDHTPWDRSGV